MRVQGVPCFGGQRPGVEEQVNHGILQRFRAYRVYRGLQGL